MKTHQVPRHSVKPSPHTQQKELDSNLENYRDLDDLDDTFDQPDELIDENLYHGLETKKEKNTPEPKIEEF